MNDLEFAFRQLLKSPGFTAVGVLTPASGVRDQRGLLEKSHRTMNWLRSIRSRFRTFGSVLENGARASSGHVSGASNWSSRRQRLGFLNGYDAQRVEHVDKAFPSRHDDAFGSEKNKLAVRHLKLGPIRRSDLEGHKAALEPFANDLNCHTQSFPAFRPPVKTAVEEGEVALALQMGTIPINS
jgi:hypothetical protein